MEYLKNSMMNGLLALGQTTFVYTRSQFPDTLCYRNTLVIGCLEFFVHNLVNHLRSDISLISTINFAHQCGSKVVMP